VDALRLDALKHITHDFLNEWIDHLRKYFKKDFLCIGEYWQPGPGPLLKYIDATEGRMQLFDVPLHYNFHEASVSDNKFDMSKILHDSLVSHKPELSVTFVDNHDTQPLQALQSPVDFWFKPLAYAIILLRQQGIPCVFYPALYEAKYVDKKNDEEIYVELNSVPHLETMMKIRKHLAYGGQRDYFDHPNTIGWIREGDPSIKNSGLAIVLTNGSAGNKKMEIGKVHAGKTFADVCGGRGEKVIVDDEGWGEFFVGDKSVSVWIAEEAVSQLE
jgi:alpha-amylase